MSWSAQDRDQPNAKRFGSSTLPHGRVGGETVSSHGKMIAKSIKTLGTGSVSQPRHSAIMRPKIKGPDNPTCQLLSISSKRKVKTGWERQERERRWWKTDRVREFCVRSLCLWEGLWKSMREFCGDGGGQIVWKRCVWELRVRELLVRRLSVSKLCVKKCVCVSCVEMVEDRLCERGKYERVVCERVVCEFCVWHVWLKTVAPSATPAAQNGGRCFQMPRLPHKRTAVAPTGTKRATRASPVPWVPRLPHEVKVDPHTKGAEAC